MLTGKQRSYLKKLAQETEPAVYIGKAGLTDSIIDEIERNIDVNELIKCQIQKGTGLDPKDTCNEVAEAIDAEFVQAIGRRFVLYRKAREPQNRKIIIPK